MVLDTPSGSSADGNKFIFKNTMHVDGSDDPLKQSQVTVNATDEKAPREFYYIHIDVDLEEVDDYKEPEKKSKHSRSSISSMNSSYNSTKLTSN